MKEFPLTNLLLVTGISFLLFTAAMYILDGTIYSFLLNTGLITLALGCFLFIGGAFLKSWERNNSTGISTDSE